MRHAATDRDRLLYAQRIGLAIALGLILTGPGCARSRPYRSRMMAPLLGARGQRAADTTRLASPEPGGYLNRQAPRARPPQQAIVHWSTPPGGPLQPPRPAPLPPAALATRPPKTPRAGAPDESTRTIRKLTDTARTNLENYTNYQVRLERQERVGNRLLPTEQVLLSIRRQPKAVRLEWADGPHHGREVIYAADSGPGQMHIHNPRGLLSRMTMAVDSPLVLKNSRHPITAAGLGPILDQLEASLRRDESGGPAAERLRYLGLETPEAVGRSCHKIVRKTETGETWLLYLDAENDLPVYFQADAADGTLLERYVFRDLKANLTDLASSDAFDPAQRWGSGHGRFPRLARSQDANARATAANVPE